METLGSAISAAGGGILGAVALLLVGLGLAVASRIWKAYQEQIKTEKDEDRAEKEQLKQEIRGLREEGREREGRLLQLVADGQRLQQETNKILERQESRLQQIGEQIARLEGAIERR